MVSSLVSVFILGLVHGLTPCEHTWPIIFSFVISQRKWQRGVLAAVFFISPATLVWGAIAGVSGFLGSIIWKESYEICVHLGLGGLMIVFGLYILSFLKLPHLHLGGRCLDNDSRKLSLRQLPLYGLVLGFGPCVPVLMTYAVAAELHNVLLGIFAGLSFGLGTMIALSGISAILSKSLELAEGKLKKDLSKICAKISGLILIIFGFWLIISIVL